LTAIVVVVVAVVVVAAVVDGSADGLLVGIVVTFVVNVSLVDVFELFVVLVVEFVVGALVLEFVGTDGSVEIFVRKMINSMFKMN
jgi:hypothetical protein